MVTVVRDPSYTERKRVRALDDAALVNRLGDAAKLKKEVTVTFLTLHGKEKSVEGPLIKVDKEANSITIKSTSGFDLELKFTGTGKDIVRITALDELVVIFEDLSKSASLGPIKLRKGNYGSMGRLPIKNKRAPGGSMSWNEFRETELETRGEERKRREVL